MTHGKNLIKASEDVKVVSFSWSYKDQQQLRICFCWHFLWEMKVVTSKPNLPTARPTLTMLYTLLHFEVFFCLLSLVSYYNYGV